MQPRSSAELPEARVRLFEPSVHLVDEALDHLDRGMPRDLADEARVEEEATHRQHHLAVDVVLDVLESLVSDPHRPVPVEPGEVRELALRRFRVAVDPVGGLENALVLLGEVAQVLEEVLHLLRVTEPLERVEREVRVAQPAEAVVPGTPRARVLGDARRRRGEERARVLVLMELERERGADDLALVVAGHACALHPPSPVVERSLEEALRGLLETRLERLAPGDDEVAVVLEQERPLVLDVRERDVGREPNGRREAGELDVVRRAPAADLLEAVFVRRSAAHPRARLTRQRTQDADEHRRLEEAVVEVEARREVDELELAMLSTKDGAQDVRVLEVRLLDLGRVDPLDRERAALLAVEERAEDEARVGSRPAEPLDGALLQESAVRAVSDDGEAAGHGCWYSRTRRLYLPRTATPRSTAGAEHRTPRARHREQPATDPPDHRRQVDAGTAKRRRPVVGARGVPGRCDVGRLAGRCRSVGDAEAREHEAGQGSPAPGLPLRRGRGGLLRQGLQRHPLAALPLLLRPAAHHAGGVDTLRRGQRALRRHDRRALRAGLARMGARLPPHARPCDVARAGAPAVDRVLPAHPVPVVRGVPAAARS